MHLFQHKGDSSEECISVRQNIPVFHVVHNFNSFPLACPVVFIQLLKILPPLNQLQHPANIKGCNHRPHCSGTEDDS